VKKTTVLASLCRTDEDAAQLREILEEQLGPQSSMVDLVITRTKKDYYKLLERAEVLFAYHLPSNYKVFAEHANKLKWVHMAAAGVDSSMTDVVTKKNFVISNSRGMHARRVSEYVMGSVIAYSKGFLKAFRFQSKKRWAREEMINSNRTLAGKTLGVLGFGALGQQIARVAQPFGIEVIALRRHPEDHPTPDTVAHVFGPQNLREFIHPCDYLAVCLPLTNETRHLLDRDEFVRLKTSSLLINVSRGAIIDEKALAEALEVGEIGGAVLDVFEDEPLPATSPLWTMENVLITPHVAGAWSTYLRDASQIFARNLRHYLEKRPLENVVDKERGY